jgi:hypothetical protein
MGAVFAEEQSHGESKEAQANEKRPRGPETSLRRCLLARAVMLRLIVHCHVMLSYSTIRRPVSPVGSSVLFSKSANTSVRERRRFFASEVEVRRLTGLHDDDAFFVQERQC